MKYEGFEVKVDVERGKVKTDSEVKNGNLGVYLNSRKGTTQKFDVDIAGHISKIYESIAVLEAAARMGNRFVAFEGEHSTTLISDDGHSQASLKVIIPKNFAKERMKRLSNSTMTITYRDVLQIESVIKNGHHHNFTCEQLDVLKAESVNFEPIRFPKVEEVFSAYCRKVDAFFTQNGALPYVAIVEDSAIDSFNVEVSIKVTFSINPELMKTRSDVIKSYRNWFRNRDFSEKPQAPKPKKIEDKNPLVGQKGMVVAPS